MPNQNEFIEVSRGDEQQENFVIRNERAKPQQGNKK